MKSFLKLVILLIIIIIGVLYYLYHQVSYTPDWYSPSSQKNIKSIIISSDKIDDKIKRELNSGHPVEINSDELASLVISNAKKNFSFNPQKVIKGLKTEIKNEKISVEAVLNIRDIPKNQLPKKARETIDIFLESVPEEMFENFYVKIEGKPVVKNGQLGWGEHSYIQLGKIKYSINELAERFLSEQKENNNMNLNWFTVSSILLQEGTIKIIP